MILRFHSALPIRIMIPLLSEIPVKSHENVKSCIPIWF